MSIVASDDSTSTSICDLVGLAALLDQITNVVSIRSLLGAVLH